MLKFSISNIKSGTLTVKIEFVLMLSKPSSLLTQSLQRSVHFLLVIL